MREKCGPYFSRLEPKISKPKSFLLTLTVLAIRLNRKSDLQAANTMKIFIWRHSKFLSSWSMFDEPHIYRDNYLQAEIAVLAKSTEEALELIEKDGQWNIHELRRIEPKVIALDSPAIVSKFVHFG